MDVQTSILGSLKDSTRYKEPKRNRNYKIDWLATRLRELKQISSEPILGMFCWFTSHPVKVSNSCTGNDNLSALFKIGTANIQQTGPCSKRSKIFSES